MENKIYKALAFDFDGTLFDTAALNFKSYYLAYYDLGVEITPEMFERTRGLSVYDFNRAMGVTCDVDRLRELKARYYAEMSVYAKPNRYLINIIKNETRPIALVTTARMRNIMPLLEKYDLANCFSVFVTQENVKYHKPNSEAYVKAVRQLGIVPSEVLVFEDTRAGFFAARDAGCDCVKVGEFRDDCIADITGGSNSRTRLLYCNGKLIVRKDAEGEVPTEKLQKECEFLKDNVHPYLIPVLSDWFTLGKFGSYVMPYVFGGSFYEYHNKIGELRNVIKRIVDFDLGSKDDVVINTTDVRDDCIIKYLDNGGRVYKEVTGQYPFAAFDFVIPPFVNDFRITRYHGDTTFENIIMSRLIGPVLIDPVPYGNVITGIAHDFSKLGQSLYGYEAIRDGREFDYTVERQIFNEEAKRILTENEYKSLKFYIACLFFRRLKYQIKQNPALVRVYGDIGLRLWGEFMSGNYEIA